MESRFNYSHVSLSKIAAVTLFKFFKRKEQSIGSSLLTSKDIESADRAVAKALEACAASKEVP